ncbi:LOW QUALITY PROTEIN: sodium/calcium exchanger 3-like [Uloborus diversus]|uniref:LOW QUALITY PROTEIN: sodium/calcium exchanger 3-like n=1 Tax=Uloborus diversus TaxID=327109 RepID=UPI00240A07C8|nr:LOW QUALITY PROTEIN: sodium/calcium exchanger 3-like [Uloborus diversus]
MTARSAKTKRWLASAFLFFSCLVSTVSSSEHNNSGYYPLIKCREGLLLPVWLPQENLSSGDIVARGIVYFVALAYLFVGVSIVADRFMASIEVITSKEKEVVIKKPNGETQNISVRIWNETVSNLTLMALGSSAPEILLSIIEVYAQDFEAGELGPGTIVGSAAFNMFVIIGICVWAVPTQENRRIKHLRVFFVTMTWSVFAYIWLYLILTLFSPGVIDVWEGLVTFMFFPATVLTAYIADRQFLIYKYMTKKYRMNKRNVIVGGEGDQDMEMGMTKINHVPDGNVRNYEEEQSDDIREFEEHRMQYIQILRELRRKHPDATMEDIEMMAREEILDRGPKSRAYYRIQATRKLMGGTNLMKRKLEKIEKKDDEDAKDEKRHIVSICFDPGHYTVMENVGEFAVTVSRDGNLNEAVAVDYHTEDGTANAGSDYEEAQGTLIFGPGETQKQFFITVIDDDVFEEDEHFYVRLSNARYTIEKMEPRIPVELSTPFLATVMILDDDHAGIFLFPEAEVEVTESVGEYPLKVNRFSGARGRVILPFRTVEGTARPGVEYEHLEGELIFENNETTKDIPLHIMDTESYEADAIFFIELGDPKLEEDYLREKSGQDLNENQDELSEDEKIALLGKPRLGEHYRVQVRIKESREFKNTVDKLFQKANVSLSIGTSSWKEQFIEAITVSAGDDDDDDEEGEEMEEKEPKLPTCSDYVMHFLTLFWKLLFALIPPADMMDGWLCFIVSILGIGMLTAVIGDLASHFGCTVGLRDTVTAVALVALGTSIPDTFASKVAAIQDKYADSSIGNVTGSNAVNVFLGIGVAWSITAIVHYARGSSVRVEPGSLAFSVTMFCAFAFVSAAVLNVETQQESGGELGGPMKYKLPTTILFVSLWLIYVLMSSMEAYGYIEGF